MEVTPGYKQTEVGVIPEEWGLKLLSELFAFSGGYTASRAQLSDAGHCYLHYGDIHAATKTTIDTISDQQHIPRLGVSLEDVSPKSLLKDGDVVFVDASEDDEGASKHVVVVNGSDVPFISGLHTIVAKSLTDELSKQYRRYCFQTRAIRQQFRYYAVGTKVKGISKTNIAKLWLPVPPIPEQRAIAAALSDVDTLLGGLDRLIVKKRDLKQAAMQQLLTGQTRLPGFSGEWETNRLGDHGRCLRGVSYDPDVDLLGYDSADTVRLLRANNIRDAVANIDDLQFVHARRVGEQQVMRRNDILICTASGSKDLVGKACRFDIEDGYRYTFGAFMGVLRTSGDGANPNYLALLLQTQRFRDFIGVTLAGSSINNLRPTDIESAEFPFPSRDEQDAIAVVLSDMGAELTALEARRDKIQDLKKAMMQELLTGKTRLVPAGAAHA